MTNIEDAVWRKASASNGADNCVEVARLGDLVGVRDSKDRPGAVLTFTTSAWSGFVAALARGELG